MGAWLTGATLQHNGGKCSPTMMVLIKRSDNYIRLSCDPAKPDIALSSYWPLYISDYSREAERSRSLGWIHAMIMVSRSTSEPIRQT